MSLQQAPNLRTGAKSLKPSIKDKMFFKNFNKPTYIDSIETKAKGTISPRGNRLSIPIFKTISKPLGKNGMKKKHLKSKRI